MPCDDAASSLARIGRSARKLQYRRSRPSCSARACAALANQTSRATEEISQQVAAIQEATKGAVNEIGSIGRTIQELTSVSTSIAAAVDQQGATTREIASSIQTAAGNTARASDEIKSVEQAANQAAAAIGEIGGWTDRLSARAQDLEAKVASFFNRVRAA